MRNVDSAFAVKMRTAAFGLATVLGVAAVAPALAQDCKADLEKLAARRISAMTDLNALAKRGKGKLDPILACPKLRGLAAAEASFLDYLKTNKDWCSIPDTVIEQISASQVKSSKFAGQACAMVVKVKKMQEQQAKQAASGALASQAPKMPTGPL